MDKQVAVVVGATTKWQSDGRMTKLAHGRTLDDSDLPVGVRWGVGGAIAQKFAQEGFFADKVAHGRRIHDFPNHAHAGHSHLAVQIGGEKIEPDRRRLGGICAGNMDAAGALGPQRMGDHGDAGLARQLEIFGHEKRNDRDVL